jgi:hypothetical protein
VCADITLEPVPIATPSNVAILFTDDPVKCATMICPLSKSDKSPIFGFFHTDRHSSQSLINWHEHYRVHSVVLVNEKHSVLPTKFFQCSQHKFYSSSS